MLKKLSFKAFICCLFFLILCQLNAQTNLDFSSYEFLPEENINDIREYKDINLNYANIYIKSNVEDANVYLNNVLQGQVPLLIEKLNPGIYYLSIKEDGYETRNFHIRIKSGKVYSYYVNMEKEEGLVSLYGLKPESRIFVDNYLVSGFDFNVDVGYHVIKVLTFGYKDFSKEIYIRNKEHLELYVKQEIADFNIISFTQNKESINPLYDSGLGRITYKINVTANSKKLGDFFVFDENNNLVYSKKLNYFNSWIQEVIWNGKNQSQEILPDGNYKIVVSIDDIVKTVNTKIDSKLFYNLLDISNGGSCIGNTLTAIKMPKGTSFINFVVSPIFKIEENPFYSVPFGLSFSYSINEWLEFASSFKIYPCLEKTPLNIGFGLKFNNKYKDFCYGFGLNYGYTTKPVFFPYGIAINNGLSCNANFGIQKINYYLGFSSEFIFGSNSGILIEKNNTFKNGICALFQQNQNIAYKLFINLHSSFGTFANNIQTDSTSWLRGLDTGFGISFLIPKSILVLNTKINSILYFNQKCYTNFETGFSLIL